MAALGTFSWLVVALITLIVISAIVLFWFAWAITITDKAFNQEPENSHEEN